MTTIDRIRTMAGLADRPARSAEYDRLPEGSEGTSSEKGEDRPFLSDEEEGAPFDRRFQKTKARSRYATVPWIVSTVLFASLYLYKVISSGVVQARLGTYESGWKTDFADSRDRIGVGNVQFVGSPDYDDQGHFYIPNPDPIPYRKSPSPEADDAWDHLIGGRYVLVSEEELRQSINAGPDDDITPYWSPRRGGYVAGFDMFHTLHCIDRLRKVFHPEAYPHFAGQDKDTLEHNGHCWEQIRQYVMCAGDMTMIPTKYNAIVKRNYVASDVTHTCRNFAPLRAYLEERYNGSLAVQPQCPNGSIQYEGTERCILEDGSHLLHLEHGL